MKPSVLSLAGLVLFGGTLVLLIGALVKFDPDSAPPSVAQPVAATQPADASLDDVADATNDLPLPPNFPTNLAQIVKMTRAGVGQDVVLAYVQTSGEHYSPNADEMIYLHDAGVAEEVLAALVKKPKTAPSPAPVENIAASPSPQEQEVATPSTPASALTPEAPAPPQHPPADSTAAYFYDDLAPYGDWVQNADSSWAWQPTVQQAVPNWQPYREDGQWEFTDAGWYWQSSYPWGWAAFHYGGWYNDPSRGWLWQPGNRWAPAWVVWRKSSTHFGWAPLPPGVSFSMEFATAPNNLADYGFTPSSYTFVPVAHFLSRNLTKYAATANQAPSILATSVSVHVNRGLGISPEEVAAVVHRPIKRLSLNDVGAPVSRGPSPSAQNVAVYRPNIPAPTVSRADSSSTKSSR